MRDGRPNRGVPLFMLAQERVNGCLLVNRCFCVRWRCGLSLAEGGAAAWRGNPSARAWVGLPLVRGGAYQGARRLGAVVA
jgi:hypothetical protein